MGTSARTIEREAGDWWRPALPEAPAAICAEAAPAAGGALPFGALMAFTAFLLLQPQDHYPELKVLRLGMLTAVTAIAAHLYRCFTTQQPPLRAGREIVLAAFLGLWALATAPFSYWPGGSFDVLADLLFKSTVVFWLIGSVVDTTQRLRRTCMALVLLAVPLSLTALHNFATGTYYEDGTNQRITGYAGALTDNPNDLALMLNLIVPLALALFFSASTTVMRAVLLVLVVLHASAVIVTFSRAGFLTLIVATLYYALKLVRRGAWGAVGAGLAVALVALPLSPAGYSDRLSTILDTDTDRTGSAQARSQDLAAAARFVGENPFLGAGAGMNMLALNDVRGAEWLEVHNVYLQFAVDLGLPGLCLFVALLAVCLGGARRAAREAFASGSTSFGFVAEGIEVSLVAFAFAGLFYPVAYNFYFFYVGGLALAARSCAEPQAERP